VLQPRLTQWAASLRQRGPESIARAVRLSVAAVTAYGVAFAAVGDRRPVTAALTALLIVQVTLVGTLADTLRRILSVLTGVGIAITVSALAGFTWWSLGALVVTSILLGQALRLGSHLLEVPISAMLILAAGGAGSAAEDRVFETLIGAGVAVLLNLAIPPSTRTRSAGQAVEAFATRLADLPERISERLAEGPVSRDLAYDWLRELRSIDGDAAYVDAVLAETQRSRRLNPRAAGSEDPVPDLRSGLDALEHSAVALRSVIRSIADGTRGVIAPEQADEPVPDEFAEVRGRLAEILTDVARCITGFGAIVRFGDSGSADLQQALDAARDARARLAEQLLVDPRETAALWQLHGSLLVGLDRILTELDVTEFAHGREMRRREAAALARPATQAAQRLRSHARRVVAENPRLRPSQRRS
jgi:hypothetical protein